MSAYTLDLAKDVGSTDTRVKVCSDNFNEGISRTIDIGNYSSLSFIQLGLAGYGTNEPVVTINFIFNLFSKSIFLDGC